MHGSGKITDKGRMRSRYSTMRTAVLCQPKFAVLARCSVISLFWIAEKKGLPKEAF